MERKDSVTLSQEEQKRLRVISEVEAGRWSAAEAARVLQLSPRQVRRLRHDYRAEGAQAFAHGNRGRPSPRRLSDQLRQQVIDLGAGRYAACNDSHLRELLALREGIVLGRATLQRIRRQAGQKPKQRRRPPRHRSRRDRRPQEGMLLQTDGSPHHWLGEDQPRCTLLGAVDDATGKVVAALFREQEDAHGYFLLLCQVLLQHGVPLDLYHDRHSIFQVNSKAPLSIEAQIEGREAEVTQFRRALDELSIGSIAAHSPEAKGRIERLWRSFQDRLVCELALAGVKGIKAANRFLPAFLQRYNASFAIQAEEPGLAYRPLDRSLDLDRILSFRYQRVVARDNTVSLEGRFLQIPPGPRGRSYYGARVWVHEFLDGSLGVWYQDRWLVKGVKGRPDASLRARRRLPSQPERPAAIPLPLPQPLPAPAAASAHPMPSASHPWRRSVISRPRRTESLSS
jgi:transposase